MITITRASIASRGQKPKIAFYKWVDIALAEHLTTADNLSCNSTLINVNSFKDDLLSK